MKLPAGKFGLIYADPPWSYRMYSDKGYEKSPDKEYSCMTESELVDMHNDLLFSYEKDCVLFMWAVWPMIDQALRLMNAWGFTYRTGGAWHKRSKNWTPDCKNPKTNFGTGYIFRSASEPFLLGTIGNPRIKNKSTRNLIEAAVREHSRKPDCTYTMLEKLFEGPYLELFARTQRPGWSAWGNEVNKFY